MQIRWRWWMRYVWLLMICAVPAAAQVPITGRVVGTIENEAGVALADVRVTLAYQGAAPSTGAVMPQARTVNSDSNGVFVIDQVDPGLYRLTVQAAFFEPVTTTIEVLTANSKILKIVLGRRSRVAFSTDVAVEDGFRVPVISTVEFQLGTDVKEPVVNTREGQLGGSFEPQRITALPLDGRNYLDLLKLQPGVFDENGGEGFASFNGGRGTAQNFTLDGTENTDADVALPSLFEDGAVSLDAIQEFRVITSNANAEYGRNSGGQVSLFVKRGGNEFHGLLYHYFMHDKLNARNFFDLDPQFIKRGLKPPALRHQFGANGGGPLVKDRQFFFTSYEGFRNREGLPRHPRVPTVGEVDGVNLFRNQLEAQFRFVENLEPSGLPPSSFPSPLLTALFKFGYPAPTRPLITPSGEPDSVVGIFDTTVPFQNDTDSFIVRTDHQLTASNRMHVRYGLSNGDESIVGNGLPGSGAGKDFRTQNVSIVNTHLIGANQVNEFRFGFSRNRVDFPTAQTPMAIQRLAGMTLAEALDCGAEAFSVECQQSRRTFAQLYPSIRFGADNSTSQGFPYFIFPSGTFANFGVDAGLFPQGRARNTFQFGDTYSAVVGRHTIRAGMDIRRLQQNSISGFHLRPSFILVDIPDRAAGSIPGISSDQIFGGQQNYFFTRECGAGDMRACAASDRNGDGIPDGPIIRGLRSTEYGLFIQDNVKLTRRLTLDAGLRYEIFGREGEADSFLSRATNAQFLPNGTLSPNFSVQQFGSGIGRTVRDADLNNFGPRLGLAWDPFGDGKMAVRASYGIYYDHIQGTTIFPSQLNPPGVLGFSIPNDIILANESRVFGRVGLVPVRLAPGALLQTDLGGNVAIGPNGQPGRYPLPLHVIDPATRDPYTQRWNLTIQRELDQDTLIELSYVGSKGTRLLRVRTPNLGPFIIDQPALGQIFFGDFRSFRRPNTQFGSVTWQESSANSIYHAFQLHAQRRFSRGISFQVSYTIGKSLDDASSNVADAGRGGSIFPQNSFDLSSERGRSAFDVRQRLVFNYVVDLPLGPGRTFLSNVNGVGGRLLEGWSVSGITVIQTGFPLTLLAGYDVNGDGVLNDRPFLVPGRSLNDLLVPGGGKNGNTRFFRDPTGGDNQFCDFNGTPTTSSFPCQRSRNIVTPGRQRYFFDPTAPTYFDQRPNLLRPFDPNLLLGRGLLTGPGRIKFDLAVRKVTSLSRLREGMNIELRAEFFNLFNHTNFADPEVNILSPQFGELTATSTSSRLIQLALRLAF